MMKMMCILAACALVVTGAFADEGAPSVGVSGGAGLASAYVWRGQVLNDEAVLQPSLAVEKGGLSLSVWANANLTDAVADESDGEFSEVDLTASYSGEAGSLGWTVGLVEYLFPHQTLVLEESATAYPGTREVFASFALGNLPVTPSVAVYYDIDEADGAYVVAGLSYEQTLVADVASLALGATAGWGTSDYNAFYFGMDDDAFNDAVFSAGLGWTPCASLSVTPAVQYVMLLDDDIKDAAGLIYKDDEVTVVSLTASYSF